MVQTVLTLRSNDETGTHTFELETLVRGEKVLTTGTIHCAECAAVITLNLAGVVNDALMHHAMEIVTHTH